MLQLLSVLQCCPQTVVRRAAIITFVQTFFSIPLPSIAVGPMLQRPPFPRYCPWTVVRKAAILNFVQSFFSIPPSSMAVYPVAAPPLPDLTPEHCSGLVTPIASSIQHARSLYSPVKSMFFLLPHLHLRWRSLSKAYVCTLTIIYTFTLSTRYRFHCKLPSSYHFTSPF